MKDFYYDMYYSFLVGSKPKLIDGWWCWRWEWIYGRGTIIPATDDEDDFFQRYYIWT